MAPKNTGNTRPNIGAEKKPDGRRKNKAAHLEPHHWKKGQSGNPVGRPPDSPEMKRLKNMTKAELADIGSLIVKGEYEALVKLAKAKKATVLQRMIAAVAVKIIDKGDMNSLDVLLNRLVGKVKDDISVTSNLPQVTISLPTNGREAKS